jgi:hypothetical protein
VRVVEIYQYSGISQKSDIKFSKTGRLAFIAVVINCTAGMEWKSQKIEIVVVAAWWYFGVRD